MVQQTPYANLRLIETRLRSPLLCNLTFTPGRARLIDLCHRFFGQPRDYSFQCKVIGTAGGAVAKYPINWGWCVEGLVSLRGLIWGVMALADAVSSKFNTRHNLIRKALSTIGAAGLNEIKQPRIWLDSILSEFVNDTLRSRSVQESGLFNGKALIQLLDEHYGGIKRRHGTLFAVLDLALAQQIFITSPDR